MALLSQIFALPAFGMAIYPLGGPDEIQQSLASRQSFLDPQLAFVNDFSDLGGDEELLISNGSSLLPIPFSPGPSAIEETIYTVQKGDTLTGIASEFDITVNTIIWANSLKSNIIKPGDELIILPVSGVRHKVVKGDTIEKIAKLYKVDPEVILSFNAIDNPEEIQIGDILIVPGGVKTESAGVFATPKKAKPAAPPTPLVDTSGYFIFPTQGYNQGRWHRFNAVDISNSQCYADKIPVYAAASGIVLAAFESGWNGGYGKYVKIEHSNGVVTLYAHNRKLLVKEGNEVSQGDHIALMGSTGKSTGCHVHFEVRGGKNPFIR